MWTSTKIQTEGERAGGTVLEVLPSDDVTQQRLRVSVDLDDGKHVEFEQDFPRAFELEAPLAGPLQPRRFDPGLGTWTRGHRRDPSGPPTTLPVAFAPGDRVPVRHHRHKVVLDWSAIRLSTIAAWQDVR